MTRSPLGLALSFVLLVSCASGSGPELEPIAPQTVAVSETLRIPLAVKNGGGMSFRFDFSGPDLAGLDRTAAVSTGPSGGEFRWTPLAAHVGTHEFTFILQDSDGDELDRRNTVIEVIAAADTAPIFLRPGAGNTYDLERTPCISFDVEVRDDDSPMVEIRERVTLMEGATLVQEDTKRARFDWCPTPDQVSTSERWTVQMEADDGAHAPTPHDYIIVLRTGTREGCPGAAPTVTILSPGDGATVTGSAFTVRLQVDDDMGVRDDPLVYYSTTAPDDPSNPDVTLFEQATAFPEGAEYVAYLPSFGLAVGEETQVYVVASATDNDDATGALCDHRTDSSLLSFTARGGTGGSTGTCETCAASEQCESGVCASDSGIGRCVPSCSAADCTVGSCGATITVDGRTLAGCGPVEDICGGSSGCSDDSREDDDSVASAFPAPASFSDGQICAGDSDYLEISGTAGTQVTVTVDGFTHSAGDLDLQLLTSAGRILASSASTMNMETVRYCMPTGDPVYARIFGYRDAENAYSFSLSRSAGACCSDDTGEPDDTRATARSVTPGPAGFDGTICPMDEDYLRFTVSSPSQITAQIVLDTGTGTNDLDLELLGPTGAVVGSSRGTTDTETIDADVPGGGTYTLRVYGFMGARGDYLGELTVMGSAAGCTETFSCPLGTVCDGSCVSDSCTSAADCPTGHSCPVAGPGTAPRHCAEACTFNADCRSGEACKRFPEGRGCGRTGSGANGARCATFADCGGQRACLNFRNGYCARAGCTANADCESGTFCTSVLGVNVCALDCWASDSICRISEGYSCDYRDDVAGAGQFVCVPP